MANYTPGEAIMFCAIFVCLFALALLALARPLRMLCKCGISGAARRGRYFSAEFFLVEAEGHCGEIC